MTEYQGNVQSYVLEIQMDWAPGGGESYFTSAKCRVETYRHAIVTPAHITNRWILRKPFGPQVLPELGPEFAATFCAALISLMLMRNSWAAQLHQTALFQMD